MPRCLFVRLRTCDPPDSHRARVACRRRALLSLHSTPCQSLSASCSVLSPSRPRALLVAPRPRPAVQHPRPTPQTPPATPADSRQHSFPCPRARPVRYLLRLRLRPNRLSPSFIRPSVYPAAQGLSPSSPLPRLSSLDDGHLSTDSAPHAPPWPPMARRLPSTIPICTTRLPWTSQPYSGMVIECATYPLLFLAIPLTVPVLASVRTTP